jgi:hypothetical protein
VSYLLGVPVGEGAGDVVVFEVDGSEVSDDLVLASDGPGKVAARARTTLEEALAGLMPSLAKVVGVLREMAPREMTVEFGMKMGGETGVIIAKGIAEVNFKVTMTWKDNPKSEGSQLACFQRLPRPRWCRGCP